MSFEYHARCFPNRYEEGVVDGDTIWLHMDLGFWQRFIQPLRLAEIDTHEIHFVSHDSEEYERGVEERDFVREWIATARRKSPKGYDRHWPLHVITEKYSERGKYGRIVAYIQRKSDGEILNQRLLEEFDDVEY